MSQLIIDVREADEFADGHVTNAINLPLGRVMRVASELKNTPKDTKIILYCRSGGRAGVAAKALHDQGFTNVINGINQVAVEAQIR